MSYTRTQTSPMWIVVVIAAAVAIVTGWLVRDVAPLAAILGAIGLGLLFVSMCFKTLTISDAGDSLLIQFGPLPVFRKRISYADITDVQPSHTAIIDGWGIHYIPGRGWTYNLWGRACVRLTVNGKRVQVGTEQPEELAQMIRAKIV